MCWWGLFEVGLWNSFMFGDEVWWRGFDGCGFGKEIVIVGWDMRRIRKKEIRAMRKGENSSKDRRIILELYIAYLYVFGCVVE